MAVKNIMFDLGGVILDLGFDRMVKKFEQLGIKDFDQAFHPLRQLDFFEQLELGQLSPVEFYEIFRRHFLTKLSNEQIEAAWNLILMDFKPERMALLEQLSKNKALYLFSNTNEIHTQCFEARCQQQMGRSLQSYFKKTFYSQRLHLRKPDPVAFKAVLNEAGLLANETLFVDDNLENIAGAQLVGLKTYHLQAPETIMTLDFSAELCEAKNSTGQPALNEQPKREG